MAWYKVLTLLWVRLVKQRLMMPIRWWAFLQISLMCLSGLRPQGWGQIRFIKYKYKYKYIFFRSFKYKYKYTGKNLIKYKYKYKYSSSNTNTNTNTQWGRDKIAAILQMTYWILYCKKIVYVFKFHLKKLMIIWNILQQTSLWDMYSRYLYTWRSEDTLKGVQRPHAVSTQWGHMDVCIAVWTGCPSNPCWHNMSYQKMTNTEISIILA